MTPSPIANQPSESSPVLTPDFWEDRYQAGIPRWDIGQPAPPLHQWLATQTDLPHGIVAVLGCGRGHDAVLFAQAGFAVTAVDYAPSAIAQTQQLADSRGVSLRLLQRDIFDLLPDFAAQFDYVVEHTCFCAISPQLRDRYVDLVADLLMPQGTFVGLFFTHSRPGGPPYGSTLDEIQSRFSRRFHLHTLTMPLNSVPARQQEEHLGIFQKIQA